MMVGMDSSKNQCRSVSSRNRLKPEFSSPVLESIFKLIGRIHPLCRPLDEAAEFRVKTLMVYSFKVISKLPQTDDTN